MPYCGGFSPWNVNFIGTAVIYSVRPMLPIIPNATFNWSTLGYPCYNLQGIHRCALDRSRYQSSNCYFKGRGAPQGYIRPWYFIRGHVEYRRNWRRPLNGYSPPKSTIFWASNHSRIGNGDRTNKCWRGILTSLFNIIRKGPHEQFCTTGIDSYNIEESSVLTTPVVKFKKKKKG